MRGIVDAVRHPRAGCAFVVLSLILAGIPAAFADEIGTSSGGVTASSEVVVKSGHRGPAVRQIQRKLGVPADGVFGPETERAVKAFQREHGLLADGIVGPLTRGALGLEPFSRSAVRRASRSVRLPRILRLIAECESGGNPRAVSPGGTYRGKYQFSVDTWRALGGRSDPADAPEWLQDRMALKLYRRAGTTPWPNCA
ncbi:MAG TPA: transglycosylase family protein [Thermoleophilaceae bacterium]|nr:transglycosylase family protein [Thermoleophilaceae bacterium]